MSYTFTIQTTNANPERIWKVSVSERQSTVSSSPRRHQIHATDEVHVEQSSERALIKTATDQLGVGHCCASLAAVHQSLPYLAKRHST